MNNQEIYQLFSELLDYPTPDLKEKVRQGYSWISDNYPQLQESMKLFADFIENTSSDRLEEIYTSTFDVNPSCYPYAGYQLFGDGYQRGEFLVKLKAKYIENGFLNTSQELADHLTVILRCLAYLKPTDTLAYELREFGLIPALQKMKEGFKNENPYAILIEVLLGLLQANSHQNQLAINN